MREIERKIIDAVIEKAKAKCPEVLDLIGVYGSAATGDLHEKSDLDLMIVINDNKGYELSTGFILDDTQIGYDIYCTTWESLEEDAKFKHPNIAKLMDSVLVYKRDVECEKRLERIRKQAAENLSSEARFEGAKENLKEAKLAMADMFLEDDLSKIRTHAADVSYYVNNALMLYAGRYFKRGVKRTFEEMAGLNLPFDIKELTLDMIRGEKVEDIRNAALKLLKEVVNYIRFPEGEKEVPSKENIAGTYEEMFSNWRNKMQEAAKNEDHFSSFVNMASLQMMIHDVAAGVNVEDFEIMDKFNPEDLSKNAEEYDAALEKYLNEYKKIGLTPKHYANVDEFAKDYTGR